MNSKQLENGTQTEKDIVNKLFRKYGYWSYLTVSTATGQPVDIIVIKGLENGYTNSWLVDAKNVDENKCSFTFDRIEPNQIMSLEYAKKFSNIKNIGFAIWFRRSDIGAFFLPYDKFIEMKEMGLKSVNMSQLEPLYKYLEVD